MSRPVARLRSIAARTRLSVSDHVVASSDAMFNEADARRLGTRRRALPMVGAGLAAMAGMFTMVSQNAMAVNFTSSDTAYKVYTDRVIGQYAAQYLSAQDTSAGPKAVSQVGFKVAELYGMCVIATQNLPVIGTVSLLIVAGEPVNGTATSVAPNTIKAQWLYMASDALSGNGDQISKMNLGQSANTLMTDTTPFPGAVGGFGLQAEVMNISNLDTNSYGIGLEGAITLPQLRIKVVPGTKTQADCAGA